MKVKTQQISAKNQPIPLGRFRLFKINEEYVLALRSWPITGVLMWRNAGAMWKIISLMDRPDRKSQSYAEQIAGMGVLALDKPRVVEFI